jgi:thiamine biosynthesis protein ThiI
MGEPDSQLVLLRFSGDVSIKGRATRHHFVGRLLHNLRDALASEARSEPQASEVPAGPEARAERGARLHVSHDRILVELPPEGDPECLGRVFGVQSLSRVLGRTPPRMDAIVAEGRRLFADAVRGRRFAVRARRVGSRERIALQARDLERELGAALAPHAAGVDLARPEVTVRVELAEDGAYLLGEPIPGAGGLPLGVEGRAVALLSGGFDSAVAAWHVQRRGVALDYVFCNLGGATHQLGALRVAKLLAERWSYGERPRLRSIDFQPVVAQLQARAQRRYWQVILKRLMLRAAEGVARERRAAAIVTGEAVGQVSSQTLRNLAVISRATGMLLLRPLAGFHKEEIIELARRIGTFETSKVVGEYCDLVPRRPATASTLEAVEGEEAHLDPDLLERAVARSAVFELRGLDVDSLALPELQVDRIPEGATLIDLRPRGQYQAWHHPNALHLEFAQALRAYASFDRSRAYVLTCDLGLLSAHLAERMRKEGFEAFHFRGGTRALRRYAEARR